MTEKLSDIPYEFTRGFALVERQNRAEQYLDDLTPNEIGVAERIAKDIACQRKPLANTLVIIPVAAAQEANNVMPTIQGYLNQDTTEPFSIILGLNSPRISRDEFEVEQTREIVKSAITKYPELDIRSTYVEYDRPVIGEIRRDLWNGCLLAAVRTNNYRAGEIIGINHDIDLVRLSSSYIRRIQAHYNFRDARHIVNPLSPATGSFTRHAYSPGHPNISAAVTWTDFYHREMRAAYEAGTVVPMSFYVEYGGFEATARTHEVGLITLKDTRTPKLLTGTRMETSPRRFIARMKDHGYDIWSDESFTASDDCRKKLEFADISKARQINIIESSFTSFIGNLAATAVNRGYKAYEFQQITEPDSIDDYSKDRIAFDYIMDEVNLTRAKALAVLERIIRSRDLSNKFDGIYRNQLQEMLAPDNTKAAAS